MYVCMCVCVYIYIYIYIYTHIYSLTQIQNMWVWPAFRQKQDSYTKIPKAYGKEMQLQDKGKSLKCSPPDITHTEFQETSSTELPLFASQSVYRRHYLYQYRNVTVLYGVTSDLRVLRKVKLSLYRPEQVQGDSHNF